MRLNLFMRICMLYFWALLLKQCWQKMIKMGQTLDVFRMESSAHGAESNLVARKCRKLWRRLKRFNNRTKKGNSEEAQQRRGDEEGAEQHGGEQQQQQQRSHAVQKAPVGEQAEKVRLARPRRRLPTELLAELCDFVPHHRLGLTKLVTSYSSCPVGLFGVHLTAQNGLPSAQLFYICSLLTTLLRERREKMVGPIKKWNENELEMYNKWKAESVHLITLLEEVKRLHASQ